VTGTFLQIRGIQGKSRQEGYRDSLDVTTWKIGADIPTDADSSKGSLTTGQGRVTALTCTILCDTSVCRQFASCLGGRHFTDAHLIVTKDVNKAAGATRPVEFLYLDMENVIISSGGLMGDVGKEPFLAISLRFARYKMYYVLYDEKGNQVEQDVAGYDIPRHTDYF
jgi:type VI protein secretion system component Hcp